MKKKEEEKPETEHITATELGHYFFYFSHMPLYFCLVYVSNIRFWMVRELCVDVCLTCTHANIVVGIGRNYPGIEHTFIERDIEPISSLFFLFFLV